MYIIGYYVFVNKDYKYVYEEFDFVNGDCLSIFKQKTPII